MTPEELVQALEERILAPGRFTTEDVLERAGGTREDAEELWTALGFPPSQPGARIFTEADAEILANVLAFRQLGFADFDVIIPMTRVLGQALSRVATAQVQAFHDALMVGLEQAEAGEPDTLDAITDLLVPGFESFINYTWRRHLVAAIQREFVEGRAESEVVGFADLVGYTKETRDLGDAELSELLGRFQRVASEQVTAAGARIVKLLGDGVMFVGPSPDAAADAALGLVEACADDEILPEVRVGLARGHIVELEGDLFGATVNRASRLADVARPNSVLADAEVGDLLARTGAFIVKKTKSHKLKGLGDVESYVIRPLHL